MGIDITQVDGAIYSEIEYSAQPDQPHTLGSLIQDLKCLDLPLYAKILDINMDTTGCMDIRILVRENITNRKDQCTCQKPKN